jgi:tyrosine-protein phosphatase YwqE
MASIPPSHIYHFDEQGMSFKVTFTLLAARMEKWIRKIQKKFLDNELIKCVGLDIEYSNVC